MSMAPCSHPPSPFHSPPLCAELGLQFWEDQICPADSELLIAATYLVAVPKQNPPSEPQSQVPVGPSQGYSRKPALWTSVLDRLG